MPNASVPAPGRSAKEGSRDGGWGVNSKEPKQIGSSRVSDAVVDAARSADVAPTISRLPTDGAN